MAESEELQQAQAHLTEVAGKENNVSCIQMFHIILWLPNLSLPLPFHPLSLHSIQPMFGDCFCSQAGPSITEAATIFAKEAQRLNLTQKEKQSYDEEWIRSALDEQQNYAQQLGSRSTLLQQSVSALEQQREVLQETYVKHKKSYF